MKRSHLSLTLTLVLALSNHLVLNGQEKTITLTTNLSGSTKEYVARDNISLQPGFSFAAASGQHFNASIDPTLIFPPAANYLTANGEITTNPSQGSVVGSIPGQFAVSSTGAATYTIPIECPQGINGMQPNISLVYNSQSGDGSLGVGWNIGGLSSITCIPRTVFSNDTISGIDLSKIADQYALDGNNLFVSKSSSYGGDGSFYYTENKTYNQISSHGNISIGSIRVAPEYFRVLSKDGTVMEYRKAVFLGITNNTSAPYKWLISSITDANGNYVTFTYTTTSRNQTVLSSVSYGGNNGSAHTTIIQFEYENKTTEKIQYIAGKSLVDGVYLGSIQIKSKIGEQPEQLLRTYGLSYAITNNRYYLSNIS